MGLNLTIISTLILMSVSFLPEGKTKTMRLVICHNGTMTIVDGAESFRVGPCSGGEWASSLILKYSAYVERNGGPSPKAKELQATLQSLTAESFKPERFDGKAPEVESEDVYVISPDPLPAHILAFFLRAEANPPSKVFVISSGFRIVGKNKDGVDVNEYKEFKRHIVRVSGDNPTVGEILEEVKSLNYDFSIARGTYLYLIHPGTQEILDNEKTAADYGFKNGAVIRLGAVGGLR